MLLVCKHAIRDDGVVLQLRLPVNPVLLNAGVENLLKLFTLVCYIIHSL